MSKDMTQKLITGILFLIILGNFLFTVFRHINLYLPHDVNKEYASLKRAYITSQYVDKHPKRWISDVEVNTYAGMSYVKGVNPILIAPDTPPLGRYLIGLSAVLFHNENIFNLLFAVGAITCLFLIGLQIFSSPVLALIAPALYTSEKIFKDQLIATPLLDIYQLFFLLFTFFAFTNGLLKKNDRKWFLVSAIGLGVFMATKFFITGATVASACLVILFLNKKGSKFITLLVSYIVSIVTLLFTYIRSFIANPNPMKFLGIQKYVFLYHKSQLILPFSIWPLLLINHWHVWFGKSPVVHDALWFFTWPIITIGSLLTILLYLLKRIKKNVLIEVYMAWIIFYLLFFSFGQITSRYLVILIPIMYLITIYGIRALFLKRIKHENRN